MLAKRDAAAAATRERTKEHAGGAAQAASASGLVSSTTSQTENQKSQQFRGFQSPHTRTAKTLSGSKQDDLLTLDANEVRLKGMKKAVLTAARLLQDGLQASGHRYQAVMVTLTYADIGGWEPDQMSTFMNLIRQYLKRLSVPLMGVWVAELQKRGAVHYHVVLFLPRGLNLPNLAQPWATRRKVVHSEPPSNTANTQKLKRTLISITLSIFNINKGFKHNFEINRSTQSPGFRHLESPCLE